VPAVAGTSHPVGFPGGQSGHESTRDELMSRGPLTCTFLRYSYMLWLKKIQRMPVGICSPDPRLLRLPITADRVRKRYHKCTV
jgi:hypothetical protein